MTTINDISDLVRILQERPDWLDAVRRMILTDELLRLPETVAKIAADLQEYSRQTNERLARLEEGQVRLEGRIGALEEGQVRLEGRIGALEEGQASLIAGQTALEEGQTGLRAGQSALEEGQDSLLRRMGRVESQINDLRGDIFEITAARRIGPTVIQQMRLRRCRAVVAPATPLSEKRLNDIRQAEIDGVVGDNADYEVSLADLVLYGVRRADDQSVWVVVEASVRIDEHDVSRARARADILSAVYKESTLAVVVGESIADYDRARAEDADVEVIIMRPHYRPEE